MKNNFQYTAKIINDKIVVLNKKKESVYKPILNQTILQEVLSQLGETCKVCFTAKTLHPKQVCNLCEDTPLGKQIIIK